MGLLGPISVTKLEYVHGEKRNVKSFKRGDRILVHAGGVVIHPLPAHKMSIYLLHNKHCIHFPKAHIQFNRVFGTVLDRLCAKFLYSVFFRCHKRDGTQVEIQPGSFQNKPGHGVPSDQNLSGVNLTALGWRPLKGHHSMKLDSPGWAVSIAEVAGEYIDSLHPAGLLWQQPSTGIASMGSWSCLSVA